MFYRNDFYKMFFGGALLALIVLLAVGFVASYLYKQNRNKVMVVQKSYEQIQVRKDKMGKLDIAELSPEVIASLTPPPGSKPAELSPEVIASLIP